MAIPREDFIMNENGDFPLQDTIINGVYMNTPYGNSDEQHKGDIINYNLGWLKQFPPLGFGINNYLNSEYNGQAVEKKLKQNFLSDGYTVRNGAVRPIKGSGFVVSTLFIDRI